VANPTGMPRSAFLEVNAGTSQVRRNNVTQASRKYPGYKRGLGVQGRSANIEKTYDLMNVLSTDPAKFTDKQNPVMTGEY